MNRIELLALPGLPAVAPGDDLAALDHRITAAQRVAPRNDDVVVVAQKIVSKAEGRRVDLRSVNPSPRAAALAIQVQKDPRLVELILSESRRVVRAAPNLLIVEHRLGYVMANAGIDQSNVAGEGAVGAAAADRSGCVGTADARRSTTTGGSAPAVVINDSFGRPWRRGTVGVALGAAGLPSLMDLRGQPDLFGRRLQSTQVGHADEIAAAASLLMAQAAESRRVVLIRGAAHPDAPAMPVAALLRPPEEDQFRRSLRRPAASAAPSSRSGSVASCRLGS